MARLGASRWLPLALLACGEPHAIESFAPNQPRRDAALTSLDAARMLDASASHADGRTTPQDARSIPEGSCFGRCGMPALLAEVSTCACDPGCFTRGDCCADKHALCAVSARTPLCTLTGRDVDSALCGTDLGWSFAHEGKVEVLFGDSYGHDCMDPYPNDDAQATLPLARPAFVPAQPIEPVACGDLLQIDKKRALFGEDTFAPILLYQDGRALSSYLGETPLTGFSDGTHAYLVARRGDTIDGPVYIGVREPHVAPEQPARTVYRAGVQLDVPYFRNPSAVTVARFDVAAPRDHDWQQGTGALLLFGRKHFAGDEARAVYLATQALPLVDGDDSLRWAPRYFAGLDGDTPRWSEDPASAAPVLDGDFSRTMQLEVAWVPALAKWVMLYGGDAPDWTVPDHDDQPRHGAIHMRLADAPWGPWTRATPAFWREHAGPFMHCDAPADGARPGCDLDDFPDDPAHSYSPGAWGSQLLDFPGCLSAPIYPSQPNFVPGTLVPCLGAQRGNLYGPSILESWTADLAGDQGYPHAATLYFMVSTWMPYQAILASLTVHLP